MNTSVHLISLRAAEVALALTVLFVVLYTVWLTLSAKAEVSSQPREEMLMCGKHGPFRKVHAITFMGVEYCGRCWSENVRNARKGA